MKISPLGILLNKNFKPDKRFYFISGNEVTLMEKIKSKIIEKIQRIENIQTKNIDTINGFVDEVGLFENKNVILVDDVLFTGRTVRSAFEALLSFGRPKKIELLVFVDRRFCRELPIQADYVGIEVDTLENEKVFVKFGQAEKSVYLTS